MRPRWQEIEKEMPALQTEYIDLDESPQIKTDRQIDHVPTFIFLSDSGEELGRLKGLVEKKELIENINNYKNNE